MQLFEPAIEEYEPGTQALHESAEIVKKFPVGQSVQFTASIVLENVPGPQGGHELLEPTKDPAEHGSCNCPDPQQANAVIETICNVHSTEHVHGHRIRTLEERIGADAVAAATLGSCHSSARHSDDAPIRKDGSNAVI